MPTADNSRYNCMY